MSYYDERDDDGPDVLVLRNTRRTARRDLRRMCDICGWYIRAGERYVEDAIVFDGEFTASVYHSGGCPNGNKAKREAADAAEQAWRDAEHERAHRAEMDAMLAEIRASACSCDPEYGYRCDRCQLQAAEAAQ